MADKQDVKAWVETWQRAGPELEVIRRNELRAWDHQASWRLLDDLLAMALEHAEPRTTSGLMEQQRLFRKLAP